MNIDVGKKVRIREEIYNISQEYFDSMTNERVIILRKKIDNPLSESPSNIYDLGYSSPSEIQYSEEEILGAAEEIDKNLDKTIEIAIVDPSGLIKIEKVIPRGLLLTDDLFRIEFQDGIRKMNLDFLLTSFLLAEEYKVVKQDFENAKKTVYDHILENSEEKLSENINEILDIFDKFYKGKLNV
jgi:hypothetical protein